MVMHRNGNLDQSLQELPLRPHNGPPDVLQHFVSVEIAPLVQEGKSMVVFL
jgi:hypothetical protein